jgi:pilus assembly protein CpaF
MDAVTVVEDEVRELVRRRGLDPAADATAVRRLVDDVIAEYDDRTLTSSLPSLDNRGAAARHVFDAIAGFGPLQAYLDDPEIEEIWTKARLTPGLLGQAVRWPEGATRCRR